jgi:adenylate kinase family enzyme
MSQEPKKILLIGLPSSGKSTIGNAIIARQKTEDPVFKVYTPGANREKDTAHIH